MKFLLPLVVAVTPLIGAEPCEKLSFHSVLSFEGGALVTSLAADDFNGDGIPDLVVGSGGESSSSRRGPGITLFTGDGRGGFGAGIVVRSDVYARQIVAADVDEDRWVDLVVEQESNNSILILRNTRGTFGEVRKLEIGERSPNFVTGDFNADGHLDLAAYISSGPVVFTGNGSGGFERRTFNAPTDAFHIDAGDVDGDGSDDLVVANGIARTIAILRGNTSSVLGDSMQIALHDGFDTFVLGDFNGDENLDLVLDTFFLTSFDLLLGPLTTASLPLRQRSVTINQPLAAGDFTGDGKADILGTGGSREIAIAEFEGERFVQRTKSYFAIPVTTWPLPVIAADFDRNGTLDIAMANGKTVGMVLNRGAGVFNAPPHIGPESVRAVADLNGDRIPDVITALEPIVWFGEPDGTYRPGTASRPDALFHGGVAPAAVVDIDRDGDHDIVAVSAPLTGGDGTLWVLLGRGDGSFSPAVLGANFGYFPTLPLIVDLDADGNLDIVAGNQLGRSGAPLSAATVAFGRGDGRFDRAIDLPIAIEAQTLRAGDINGDGRPDLLASNGYQHLIALNTGRGTFQTTRGGGGMERTSELADVNGDGRADWIFGIDPYLHVRLARNDGSFAEPLVSKVPIIDDTEALRIADFDSDGRLDVVVQDSGSTASTYTFVVMRGKGTGLFDEAGAWRTTDGDFAVLDFNGDGRPDVIHRDVVRLNTCTAPFARRRGAGR